MNSTQIANLAIKETKDMACFVSPEVRELAAIGKVAILIDGMDESIASDIRILRLSQAIAEVRSMLQQH